MDAYIKAIEYYLPKNIYTNIDLQKDFPEWTVEKVTSKIGIEERHIADKNETSSDMAVNAAEILFSKNPELREKIDFIIFCTQSPDYKLPTTACIIQNRLGLKTLCGAYDMNLGCSGYIYGLFTATAYIKSKMANNVLLLTGETYSKYIYEKDKGNRSLFGDAATATVISSNGFLRIGEFSLGTDGGGADNLILKTGMSRFSERTGDISCDENGNPVSPDFLFMEGTKIFNFTLNVVPKSVENCLEKNEITKDDVDLAVFHQANKYILNFVRKKIQIPEDKFFYCLKKTGNTVSSTIPIAINEAKKENKLKGKILLAGFGVGLSWGSVMVYSTL